MLQRHLQISGIDIRHGLVEAATRAPTPEILALLATRAKVEKAAKVQAAIAALVEVEAAAEAEPPCDDGYPAVTGAVIAIPARRDLGSEAIPAPSDEACIAFVALVDQIRSISTSR